MKARSKSAATGSAPDRRELRDKIIGLGELSHKKTYFPELRRRLSELEESQEALIQAKERAEQADRAKSEFLNIASHELKTPITSASLLLMLLKKQLAMKQAPDPVLIERIETQITRLTSMVHDLVDLSRLERRTFSLHRTDQDITRLAREITDLFRLRNPEREVVSELPPGAITVAIDPARIAQVLDNLLDNAAKYSPAGSPIHLHVFRTGHSVRLEIIDRGEGIPGDELPHLFTRFYRSPSDIVRKSAGLGLGLFICKEIVELHDGEIGVRTQSGAGSTFWFTLPVSRT